MLRVALPSFYSIICHTNRRNTLSQLHVFIAKLNFRDGVNGVFHEYVDFVIL